MNGEGIPLFDLSPLAMVGLLLALVAAVVVYMLVDHHLRGQDD